VGGWDTKKSPIQQRPALENFMRLGLIINHHLAQPWMVMTLANIEEKSPGFPPASSISGRRVEVVCTDALASAKKRN
jgi:hypothetical protein